MPSNYVTKGVSTSPTPTTPKAPKASNPAIVETSALVSGPNENNRPFSSNTPKAARTAPMRQNPEHVTPLRSSESSKAMDEENLASRRPIRTPKAKPNYRECDKDSNEEETLGMQEKLQLDTPKKGKKRANSDMMELASGMANSNEENAAKRRYIKKMGPQEITNEFSDGPVDVPSVVCEFVSDYLRKITEEVRNDARDPRIRKPILADLAEDIRGLEILLTKHRNTGVLIREHGIEEKNDSDNWDQMHAGDEARDGYPGRMELSRGLVTARFLSRFADMLEDESWYGDLIEFYHEQVSKPHYDLFEEVKFSRHRINLLDVAERNDEGNPKSYEQVVKLIREIDGAPGFRQLMMNVGSQHKRIELLLRGSNWKASSVLDHALKYARQEYFPRGKFYHRLLCNILNNISYNLTSESWEIKTYTFDTIFAGTDYKGASKDEYDESDSD